jgi:hypothetical protein
LGGVNVTNEDYRRIFFAMKKASEFSGHDRPVGRAPVTRTKAEMDTDLMEIWNYERDLKKRRDELEKLRKNLENPPVAHISSPLANPSVALGSPDQI